jgi:uncharacterized protein (TIGR02391 family)
MDSQSQWKYDQLNNFIESSKPKSASGGGFSSMRLIPTAPREIVVAQSAIIEKILNEETPHWRNEHPMKTNYEFHQRRDAAISVRALLLNQQEISDNFTSEISSHLIMGLHPKLWEYAAVLWEGRHYRAAIQKTSSALDLAIQEKLGRRDITGNDLINQGFSSDLASEGKPRFRVPNQINEESTKNLESGLKFLGSACFYLARNPTSHSPEEITEQEGLELLAMMSRFLKLLETCTVIRS